LDTQKRLADIELEFATDDDDDELLHAGVAIDDEWSCIDTRAAESSASTPLPVAGRGFSALPTTGGSDDENLPRISAAPATDGS